MLLTTISQPSCEPVRARKSLVAGYVNGVFLAATLGLAVVLCAPAIAENQSVLQDHAANSNSITSTLAEENIQQASRLASQHADFEHILFEYFQQHYDTTLMLIEVGDMSHQFLQLSTDNQDRLRLMQGAAQLNTGLYHQAQTLLLSLLSRTTSEYVQANTWFWLAKAGFQNRQYALSERAFMTIEQGRLQDFISTEQWQELIYLTAFSRMQQGQDWQVVFDKLDEATVYPAYIQANLASSYFNKGQYAAAQDASIAAKQALLSHQRIQNSWLTRLGTRTRSWIDFSWLNPFTWFSSDPNAQSQGNLEAQQQSAQQQEVDALYDRINLGLAYSLLQQQDNDSALDVINTVSTQSGESEQALLTLGWVLAQQNRWQNALAIWQHLREQSSGLYGLQASYGMAYAYQQQGDFSQAFNALDDTTEQIRITIDALQQFSEQVKGDLFFDGLATDDDSALLNQHWPINLLDIKRVFLSTQPDFDAAFLLSIRQQAKQALVSLDKKAQQMLILEQMLSIREKRFVERQQALSLANAKNELEQANSQLQAITTKLNDTDASKRLRLEMASPQQAIHLQRIDNAQRRLSLLLNDDTRTRPLNPKLQRRLARTAGIMQWQLDEQFITQHWQHRRLLQHAQNVLNTASQNYQQLSARQLDTQLFAVQQQSIEALNINIAVQQVHAERLYTQANAELESNLLAIIARRTDELSEQQVNTRLAKLRLQDLTPEAQ